MKVILLKGVPKVGKPEEVVEVNEGFARNALFPRKLAIPATEAALAALARKQSGRAADKAMHQSLLDKAIAEAQGKSLVYFAAANEQGNLFAKLDAKHIAQYLIDEHRLSIDPKCIIVPDGAIKKAGRYSLKIEDGGYSAAIELEVKGK